MGPMLLFSGCRAADSDLHVEEKAAAVKEEILNRSFLALSRTVVLRFLKLVTFLISKMLN